MKDDNNLKFNERSLKVKAVALPALQSDIKSGAKFLDSNYSIISDLKLDIEAIIGTAEITVKQLFDLQIGSIIELDQSIDTLITLRLNGKSIAFGSLVVVGDNFGIKIVEIIDTKTEVV